MPWWPVLLFGWGPVVVAVIAFSLAFRLNRPWLAFLGVAITTPFLFLISGYPRLMGPVVAPTILLANCASAVMLRKGHRGLAMTLLVPFVILASLVAYIVVTQAPPGASRGYR